MSSVKNGDLRDWIKIYDFEMNKFTEKSINLLEENIDTCVDVQTNWRRCKIYNKVNQNTEYFDELKGIIRILLNKYKTEINNPNLNTLTSIEIPNIIKYTPLDPSGNNHFHVHADNWDISTSTRQLSIIIYLNDVDEGGSTTFPDLNITVKPKKGRVLIFPPFYSYLHKAESPISNPKYIIVSWIHFSGNGHKYVVDKLY